LEVLKWVTDHHPATVRQVADQLGQTKGVVRTTVLNVMSRLVAKGYLTRKKADGVFVYEPRVPKAQLLRTLVRDFVDKALGGSVSPFMMYLAEDANLSEAEVAQLKKILRTLDVPSRKPARKEEP
jgi:BlaI family penicillinase repressor